MANTLDLTESRGRLKLAMTLLHSESAFLISDDGSHEDAVIAAGVLSQTLLEDHRDIAEMARMAHSAQSQPRTVQVIMHKVYEELLALPREKVVEINRAA